MPSWITDQPFLVAFAVLFVIVFCRAQATYWIARGARAGVERTRFESRLNGPRATAAAESLNKWGWPLVSVSFLTVGLQTAVNAAAGLTRMPWLRYTLAMIIGCLMWAAVYASVGAAAFQAWVAVSARTSWAPWVLGSVVVVAGFLVLLRLRRRRRGELRISEPGVDATR